MSARNPVNGSVLVNTARGQVCKGRLRDISDSGVGAILYGSLEVGSVVQLVFEHPEGTRQTRRAIVKQRFGYRYGFAFLVTDAASLAIVERVHKCQQSPAAD